MDTTIIAEFCQNHNGDFETLERMVAQAAQSGATHGKIQHIFARNLTFRPEFENGLIVGGETLCIKRPYGPEYSRLKSLEISLERARKFVQLCKREGLVPMTTCFDRGSIEEIAGLGFDTVKVASYDCGSFQMLRELSHHFDHLVISTGGTFDSEIKYAAKVLAKKTFTFLHCVSIYPTPLDLLCLARMNFLKQYTSRVGFSDHSDSARHGALASKLALFLGAEVIERHFTILPADETKDGRVSINPEQLSDLVKFAHLSRSDQADIISKEWPDWQIGVGQEDRQLSEEERLNRGYYRGRFATPRPESTGGRDMVFNWEEAPFIDEQGKI